MNNMASTVQDPDQDPQPNQRPGRQPSTTSASSRIGMQGLEDPFLGNPNPQIRQVQQAQRQGRAPFPTARALARPPQTRGYLPAQTMTAHQRVPNLTQPFLVQYKIHATGQSLGVGIIHLPASAYPTLTLNGLRRAITTVFKVNMFNIHERLRTAVSAKGAKCYVIAARWKVGQFANDASFDSVLKNDSDLQNAVAMMERRGSRDMFVTSWGPVECEEMMRGKKEGDLKAEKKTGTTGEAEKAVFEDEGMEIEHDHVEQTVKQEGVSGGAETMDGVDDPQPTQEIAENSAL